MDKDICRHAERSEVLERSARKAKKLGAVLPVVYSAREDLEKRTCYLRKAEIGCVDSSME